jgi:cytochrome bd-type quinol oxidase subunit 2
MVKFKTVNAVVILKKFNRIAKMVKINRMVLPLRTLWVMRLISTTEITESTEEWFLRKNYSSVISVVDINRITHKVRRGRTILFILTILAILLNFLSAGKMFYPFLAYLK